MEHPSKEDEVRKVLESDLGWSPVEAWPGQPRSFFSIAKPNIHDNKAEFILERDSVTAVVQHLVGVLEQLSAASQTRTEQQQSMIDRLRPAIDEIALKENETDIPKFSIELAVRNVVQSGFFHGSLLVLANMYVVYHERMTVLREQEQLFWNTKHRPPNHYARTIALRLAKFYAREFGRKPTYGTSSDGPFPSTDFGRALEKIFGILEIKAKLSNPAKWAVKQVADSDLQPDRGIIGTPLWQIFPHQLQREHEPDSRQKIAELLMKGRSTNPL